MFYFVIRKHLEVNRFGAIEYKVISADPSDDFGSSVDLSGDGLFAGIAINF